MRRLSQISSSLLIQKRHPQILWLQGIFIITWFALIAPIMALDFSQLSDFSAPTQEIISRLNCTLYPFVSFALKLRVDRIDSELIDKQETFDKNLPLSGVIQMSAINQNGFDALSAYKKRDTNSTKMLIEHAKRVCVELYKKYIKVGSELEINIGYDDRIALTMLIDDETWFMDSESQINELFAVFDDAATEVLKLLMSSFFRFQHKDEWKIACNVLDEINN